MEEYNIQKLAATSCNIDMKAYKIFTMFKVMIKASASITEAA